MKLFRFLIFLIGIFTTNVLYSQCTTYGTTVDIDFTGTCNETSNQNHNDVGTITIVGDLSFSSGRFTVRGPVVVEGNLTFTGTASLRILVNGSLRVADGGTVTGQVVEIGANGSLTIDENGSMSATTLTNDWSGPATNNIIVNGDLTVSGTFTNGTDGSIAGSGTIDADITDNGSSTFTGTHNGTCTGGCNGTLPVELISFEASNHNGNCKLIWSTATELNNDGFEVERSYNGIDFEVISFIEGNGTTNEVKNYQFLDKEVAAAAYYRLRQIDFDGAFEFSPTVYFQQNRLSVLNSIRIYPTKHNGSIKLSDWPNEIATIKIISLSGVSKKYNDVLSKNKAELLINEFLLSPETALGTYLIHIVTQNGSWTNKVIK